MACGVQFACEIHYIGTSSHKDQYANEGHAWQIEHKSLLPSSMPPLTMCPCPASKSMCTSLRKSCLRNILGCARKLSDRVAS